MPYLSVSSGNRLHAEHARPATCEYFAICARHGTRGIDQVVREVHEEWLVADDGTRAEDGVPEPQRGRLPDIDAVRIRRHDLAHGVQEFALALGLELLLELMVAVEVILDRPLGVARDEHELAAPAASASSAAYWISGLSTIGSISFGLAFVAGRKRVPRPATGNTAADLGH